MPLAPITHEILQHPSLAHGFFGRAGGVSTGLYAGLNCGNGSYDQKEAVAENRRRVALRMGVPPERLCSLYQVHSARVVTVDAPLPTPRPEADALVTRVPGLALGILTADCAPVLFADSSAGVIGAAHAGWKGAVGGVVEATVAAMEALGAARGRIRAVVGPTIAQASYEVGPEFMARFSPADQAQFFIPSPRHFGHALFDLPSFVAHQAHQAGLMQVAVVGRDTCAEEATFFSYRRATLRDEPDYGRQISIITLNA